MHFNLPLRVWRVEQQASVLGFPAVRVTAKYELFPDPGVEQQTVRAVCAEDEASFLGLFHGDVEFKGADTALLPGSSRTLAGHGVELCAAGPSGDFAFFPGFLC
jgi:hypothetical protein